MIKIRSNNWRPFNEAAPIYKNTPNNTGIGIWLNNGVRKTEHPIVKKIKIWVTRCSRTPRNRQNDSFMQGFFCLDDC